MPGQETVFICYRRQDSAAAVLLRDQLAGLLNPEAVFFDQDMRPGSDFPDEIKQALARVKLVLVLIGQDWLQAMLNRAAGPARTDWVFEEVKAALDRLQQGDGLVLIPLLVEGAEMPAEGSLPAELDTLWRQNATALKAQAATLPPDHNALLTLVHQAGLVSYRPRNDAATLTALGSKVKALLALRHMADIRAAWTDQPCTPNVATDIRHAVIGLTESIENCEGLFGAKPPWERAAIKSTCQSLLTLLCNMDADFALADHLRGSEGRWIVPAGQAGHAVNLLASTLNAQGSGSAPSVQLAPADGPHPVYANVIDIGVAGIGSDQTAHLHAALWAQLRKLPKGRDVLAEDYPVDRAFALAPDSVGLEKLKGAVQAARDLKCPVIAAQELASTAPGTGQVLQDAASLGVDYLAYGRAGIRLTRCPPSSFNPVRLACQQTINNILSP